MFSSRRKIKSGNQKFLTALVGKWEQIVEQGCHTTHNHWVSPFSTLVSAAACWHLTIVAVSDAILKHGLPLVLFSFCHHAEVIVTGIGMPQDERELCGALKNGGGARLRRGPCENIAMSSCPLPLRSRLRPGEGCPVLATVRHQEAADLRPDLQGSATVTEKPGTV